MSETNWKELISYEMKLYEDSWDNLESSTISQNQLMVKFDDDYGWPEGIPFCIWTKTRVYFPVVYDGAEWCSSVSRDPDGNPKNHVGGGC